MTAKTIEISQSALSVNGEIAELNRAKLNDAGIVAVNLMASPGAGKTSLIERTIRGLEGRLRIGMINRNTSVSTMDADLLLATEVLIREARNSSETN